MPLESEEREREICTSTTSLSSDCLSLKDWYHGIISKKEAEDRLLKSGLEGSLLLRGDQNSAPNKHRYCLSWFSPIHHSILHYPITRVCGAYFMFGRSFLSLLDVIEEFISRSNSKVFPLPPPLPEEIFNRQRLAILPFRALPDSDEISFCEGDLLIELQQVDEQWIWAKLERTGEFGLVAISLTLALNDKRIRPEELPFFHHGEPDELANLLVNSGRGSYLLRLSTHHANCYSIILNTGKRIEKFLIRRVHDVSFELGGRFFETIPDIIDRYSRKEICSGNRLHKAVLRDIVGESRKPLDITPVDLRHLHSYNSCPHPKASTTAFRKLKDNKWKSCFIILNDTCGSQLYVFESEKHAKPKVVVDLCFCFVYKIDESILERPNCLYIVFNGFEVSASIYLSFYPESQFLMWFSILRCTCLGIRHSSSIFAIMPNFSSTYLRTSSVIYLTITSYRGSSLKAGHRYSANVLVNGIALIRTRSCIPTAKNYVTFDARFILEYIPPGPCNLQFHLYAHAAKGRQSVLKDNFGRVSSALHLLPDNGSELCMSSEEAAEGFLFRALRYRIALLPEEQYQSFFGLLTSHAFKLCLWVGSIMQSLNRNHFSRLLLTVLLPKYSILFAFLDELLAQQLQTETETTLFRGDSFCVCCITNALKMTGRDIALEELSPLLQHVQPDKSSSLDVDSFLITLENLNSRMPPLFRAVLSRVARATSECFPTIPHISRRAVSSFFMLRFINPILTFWNSNDVASSGSALQLAKSVQSIVKQACMPDFDPTTCSQAVRSMANLLDSLSTSPQVDNSSTNPFVGYSRVDHLAMLAFHVERVLEQREEECPLPEASTVIHLLRAHAEKCMSTN